MRIGSDEEVITLSSPGYPAYYHNEILCTWTVTAATESRHILLSLNDFYLEDGFDFLSIGNGDRSSIGRESTIVQFSGEVKLRTITSVGDSMWLQFATDRTGIERGFNINFTQVLTKEGMKARSFGNCVVARKAKVQLN